jgi:hypothetical protein
MAELRIWYSVSNGGDGSACPIFCESRALAEWHQDHIAGEWGKPCTGSILIHGDNLSVSDLTTVSALREDLEENIAVWRHIEQDEGPLSADDARYRDKDQATLDSFNQTFPTGEV